MRIAQVGALLSLVLGIVPPAAEPRAALIARSKVWHHTDIPSMNLALGPGGHGSFAPGATIRCDFIDKQLSGKTPKFPCRLPGGDELKVKYGGTNRGAFGEG